MQASPKILPCLLIFAALLFAEIQYASAQEKNESKYALKVYLNANQHFNDKSGMQAGLLSAALSRISPKGNFMEFELSELELATSNATVTAGGIPVVNYYIVKKKQYLKLRYEYVFALLDKSRKFVPYLGASLSPYLLRTAVVPTIQPPVPTAFQKYGLSISVVPRVQWNISSRCFIDLNIPVAVIDGSFGRNVVRNPAYTKDQQTTGFYQGGFIADLAVRFGIGIRL